MLITKKLWAVALLAVGVAVSGGCASETQDDGTPPAETHDELIFDHGSVDHAAIVEVTTMMLVGDITTFATVLDPYNQDDPFRIHSNAYTQPFTRNLLKFDASDHKTDWTADQAKMWVSRVASGNYLVVDTSKPCDFANPHTYLEIERAQLTGHDHVTCGGRMPNEDALDVTVNFLVRGPAASAQDREAIHDGVEQATKLSTDTFPYIGEMNGI